MAFFAVKTSVALIVVGILFVIIGSIILPVFHDVLVNEFKQMMPLTPGYSIAQCSSRALTPGSQTLPVWKEPGSSSDMYLKFYFFDVQNPDEVLNGAKPILKEMGPYVYKELKVKKNITFETNSTNVVYREVRTMIFNRELSVGPENDTFTTVNAPLVTVVTLLRTTPFLEDILDTAIKYGFVKNETFLLRLSVHNLLWGYQDQLLLKVAELLKVAGVSLPIPKDGYFGFFYQKNNTDDGVYTVNSGADSLNNFMQITSWKYSSHVPYWKTEKCNKIVGTDGTLYHPFVSEQEGLSLFSSDLCRSITLNYANKEKYQGVDLRRYGPSTLLFAYPPENPDNACYCVGPACPHSGVLNISACQMGAPVFVSQPHFLEGPYYQSLVVGLHPDASIHETFIDVEPNTGVVMRGAKRLQLNLDVVNNSRIDDMKSISNLLFPLLWLEESGTINSDGLVKFKQMFLSIDQWMNFLTYFLIFLGALIVLLTLFYILVSYKRSKTKQKKDPSPAPTERSPLLKKELHVNPDNDWADMIRDNE